MTRFILLSRSPSKSRGFYERRRRSLTRYCTKIRTSTKVIATSYARSLSIATRRNAFERYTFKLKGRHDSRASHEIPLRRKRSYRKFGLKPWGTRSRRGLPFSLRGLSAFVLRDQDGGRTRARWRIPENSTVSVRHRGPTR